MTYCYTSELNCKFLANYYERTAVKFFFDFIGYKSRDAYKDEDAKEDGYVALENQNDVTASNQSASSFESAVNYGGRARLFSRTLELLGESGAKIFLYESPTRPVASYHIGTSYKKLINDSIKDYPNVTLLDFDPFKTDLAELDKDFFDRVHLKREGAQLFTKVMSKMISQKN